MSIFGSFEIGRTALQAQHKGMEVSGQNVANANTPGYSRQRVELAAVAPPPVAGVSMAPGNGVAVTGVIRVRSGFYHTQMINTASQRAYWETRREIFQGAEVIFMEPDQCGINQYLSDFFDTWTELASSPESMAVREGLREQAGNLTGTVQNVYLRLQDQRINYLEELQMCTGEVNRLAGVLSELNDKVRFVDALGRQSNELLDQVDLALEELSQLIDIRVHYKENGTVEVFAGGRLLVQEEHSFPVTLELGQAGERLLVAANGSPLEPRSGRILGILDAVNEEIPALQQELDRVVSTLVAEINSLHRSGYGLEGESGNDFFVEIEANGVPASLQFAVSDNPAECRPYCRRGAAQRTRRRGKRPGDRAPARHPLKRSRRGLPDRLLPGDHYRPWGGGPAERAHGPGLFHRRIAAARAAPLRGRGFP